MIRRRILVKNHLAKGVQNKQKIYFKSLNQDNPFYLILPQDIWLVLTHKIILDMLQT